MSESDRSDAVSPAATSGDEDAGSRMHVLDWLESPAFLPSLHEMIAPTSLAVPDDAWCQPKGRHDPRESVLTGKGDLTLTVEQREELLGWWLIHRRGAKLPTWDLVVTASDATHHRPDLILVEAKAHKAELSDAGKAPPVRETAEQQQRSDESHAQIGEAIAEASRELSEIQPGVSIISRDESFQLANRIAFSWELASMGIPVALIYLGFVGDGEVAEGYFKSPESWLTMITSRRISRLPNLTKRSRADPLDSGSCHARWP